MQRFLVILGIVLLALGLLWPLLTKLNLGRLPGDIVIDRPGLKVFIPVTSAILVSILLSILFWIFKK